MRRAGHLARIVEDLAPKRPGAQLRPPRLLFRPGEGVFDPSVRLSTDTRSVPPGAVGARVPHSVHAAAPPLDSAPSVADATGQSHRGMADPAPAALRTADCMQASQPGEASLGPPAQKRRTPLTFAPDSTLTPGAMPRPPRAPLANPLDAIDRRAAQLAPTVRADAAGRVDAQQARAALAPTRHAPANAAVELAPPVSHASAAQPPAPRTPDPAPSVLPAPLARIALEPPRPNEPATPRSTADAHAAARVHIGAIDIRILPAPPAPPPATSPPARPAQIARTAAVHAAPLARGFGVFGFNQS